MYLYHAMKIQPIRIQESRCVFDGIQLNLPIVRCDLILDEINFSKRIFYGMV